MRAVPGMRVLAAVEDAGSFSAAGAALGITQSAVSQHVAALERQVGQELVLRGTRPVELTSAGRVLADHGRAVAARLEQAARDVAEVGGRGAPRLRLGCFPTALATFVPRAISRLRETLPGVTVSVTDDHMPGLVPRLRERRLDLAVVFTEPGEDLDDDLVVEPLFPDRYRVLVPRGHVLADRHRDPTLRDLRDETWIGGGSSSTWFRPVRRACLAEGFDPATALSSDEYLAVQAFVASGLGVAVLPGLATVRHLSGVRAHDLRGAAPERVVQVARPAGPFVPEPVTLMSGLLREVTRARAAAAAPPRRPARAGRPRR